MSAPTTGVLQRGCAHAYAFVLVIAFVLLRVSSCPSIRPEGSSRGTQDDASVMLAGPKEQPPTHIPIYMYTHTSTRVSVETVLIIFAYVNYRDKSSSFHVPAPGPWPENLTIAFGEPRILRSREVTERYNAY